MLVTTLEWLGFTSGVACVWLMVKQRTATWPVGIVNSASWLALFWVSKIYLNSLLQIVYIVLGVYGWWYWVRERRARADDLPVRRVTRVELATLAVVAAASTAILTWVTANQTDSVVPFWDASTVVVSILATYLQAKKVYESWFLWLSVDVVYLVLYSTQDLYLTALTQVVFGALCIQGLREWQASMRDRAVEPATA